MTSPATMVDAIRNAVLYQLMNVHTAFPGTIIEYDSVKRRATIQPLVDKKYTDGTTQAMPQLFNVPVLMPAYISFPVNIGDNCLVICCERSIETWLTTGQQNPPVDPRKFDLSDGVAIVGLNPFTESNSENNSDVVINRSGSEIRISASGAITIKTASTVAIGNATTEVLDVISSFLGDMMTAIYAPPAGVIDPATLLALQLLQAKINLLKGTIT